MGATLKPHQVAIRTANPGDLPVLTPLINPAFATKTFPGGTVGPREKNIANGITPAVNNNPTTNSVFSARSVSVAQRRTRFYSPPSVAELQPLSSGTPGRHGDRRSSCPAQTTGSSHFLAPPSA
jgi:hypothetical protein